MLAGDDTEEHLSRLGSALKDLWVSFADGRLLKQDHVEISSAFTLSADVFDDRN